MRYRKGWIALVVLAFLAPLGIIAAGGAWGEWGLDEIEARLGYVPRGMSETARDGAKRPLAEYEVPGLTKSGARRSVGYIIAAVAGAAATAGAVFVLAKGATRGGIS